MSVRHRLLLPLALTILVLAAVLMLPDLRQRADVMHRLVQVGKGLGAIGCFSAVFALERGDYLRRAFALQGISLLLLARDAVLDSLRGLDASTEIFVQQAFVSVGNVTGVCGAFLLARAWQASGLELPGTPRRRLIAFAVAMTVGLAVTAGPLVRSTIAWVNGADLPLFVIWVSSLSDVAGIAFMAPIALTAFEMRGGLLGLPFNFYLASMSTWLLYDLGEIAIVYVTSPILGAKLRAAADALRVLACVFVGLSGFAQRAAILAVLKKASSAAPPRPKMRRAPAGEPGRRRWPPWG